MYTEEDLNQAVKDGIFQQESVNQFRDSIAAKRHTTSPDEENFRLIASFNDIFVVLACILLLASSYWISADIGLGIGPIVVAALSWPLAEFFVLRRKMALPAIVLLGTFVGGAFFSAFNVFNNEPLETQLMAASGVAVLAAVVHWFRFAVPITVAAGTAAAVSLIAAYFGPRLSNGDNILYLLLALGFTTFAFAMYWDSADRHRTTRNTDIAFWLHLLSAPLIVHPVFSLLGILDGNQSPASLGSVIVLYAVLTYISLIVDRRAFMVSSLVYVLYALNELLAGVGLEGRGFAFAGVLISGSLLLLSGFWHRARMAVVATVPSTIRNRVPIVSS